VATVTGAIVDGIDITDAQNVVQIFAGSVSDVFTVSDALSVIRGIPITVTDGIGVHDALLSQLGVLVIETLLLQETLGPQFTYHLTATDGVGLHDALVRGLPGSITDGIGIHDVQLVAQMVRIIESLGLTDVITPAAKYNLAITENVQFTSLLARFFGASIVENMQWVGSAVAVGQLHQALAENIGIHDDTTNSRMVFRATVSDTLDVTDAALIKMIFQGAITEGIQISAAYIEPSGSITTWAMNTRSAAVIHRVHELRFQQLRAHGQQVSGSDQGRPLRAHRRHRQWHKHYRRPQERPGSVRRGTPLLFQGRVHCGSRWR
jgi:hypothetical protein